MRFLLAIDIHEAPEDLLQQAAAWVLAMSGTLDLLYVDEYRYNTYLVSDPAVQVVLDEQWDKIQHENEERLVQLLGTLPEAIRGSTLYRVGRAAQEVLEQCPHYDALLIGTHGRTGLNHALIGSVAERVVRHATRPVLVLRCGSKAAG
jgi:nucleotide-binding universal stress UspA family protein